MSLGASTFARLRAGRIVHVQIRNLPRIDDINALHAELTAEIQRAGTGVVICSDCRFAPPLSREVAHIWARSMRQINGRVLRSAIMLDPANTMFNLQLERVVRCSIHPDRRLFEDPAQFRDWVGGELSEAEQKALREVLPGANV